METWCNFLLMLVSAVVLFCLLAGLNQWPFIVLYWAVLTFKNAKAWLDRKP